MAETDTSTEELVLLSLLMQVKAVNDKVEEFVEKLRRGSTEQRRLLRGMERHLNGGRKPNQGRPRQRAGK